MYFGMRYHKENGKVYQRRVGPASNSFNTVKAVVVKHKGYIQDETGKVIAQAFNKDLPLYIGAEEARINIGSGEDCFVEAV